MTMNDVADADTIVLWGKLAVPRTVTHAAAVRISDADAREELHRLIRALAQQASDSPVGDALGTLGADITELSESGERDRAAAGLVEVRLCDLDPRAPTRLLAYVGVVRNVLVALIPSSAIEADLPPHPGDRMASGRNAATELIREAVVRVPGLHTLAVPRLDRLLRNIRYQGEVLDDLRRHEVRLWTDTGLRDLTHTGEMAMTALEGSMKGDADAIQRKTVVLGGRIGAIATEEGTFSKRDFNYLHVPLGYRPRWRKVDGMHVPVKGSIEIDAHATQWVQSLWEGYAAGLTLRQLGDRLAALGLSLRDGSGRTLADLTGRRRISVVHHLITAQLLLLHRTGEWVKERSTSAPILQAGGHVLERRADGRRGVTVAGRLPVHMIDGQPWGIEPDVWEAAERRLLGSRRRSPADRGRTRSSGNPFTTTEPRRSGEGCIRLEPVHTTVQLRWHPGTEVTTSTWEPSSTRLVASCNAKVALKALGTELMTQLVRSASGEAFVEVLPASQRAELVAIDARLAEANAEIEEADASAKAAAELAVQAQREGRVEAARAQLVSQDGYLLKAAAARRRHLDAQTARDDAAEKPDGDAVDLRTPIGVAAAMMRWDGTANPDLRRALLGLGMPQSLRVRLDDRTGQIVVHADVTLTRVDDSRVRLPLATSWPNTAPGGDRRVDVVGLVCAWARGQDFGTLAEGCARPKGWARRAVAGWLAARGVRDMGTALLDCPVPALRAAVVVRLEPDLMPDLELDLNEATIDHLAGPYLQDSSGRWKAWTGRQHEADRRMLRALELAGGEADVAALGAASGADPARLTAPQGRRSGVTTTPAPARRRLVACPHPDCPSRWASHVLYVPETAGFGVLCGTCRRLPDQRAAAVVFPEAYLRPWDRQRTRSGYVTAEVNPSLPVDEDFASRMGDLIRPVEIARILDVRLGTVGALRRRGQLPVPVDCGGVALWRAEEIKALRRRRARRTGVWDDEWLSPQQAAELVGVPDWMVRRYCDEGLLAHKRVGLRKDPHRRIHVDVLRAFVVPPGDLVEAMTVAEAARRVAENDYVLRHAIRNGRLRTVTASGGGSKILPADLSEWDRTRHRAKPAAALPGTGSVNVEGRLSVSAAASLLGLSAKQVRRLADHGRLDDHRADGTGWRWFDAHEVLRLAATQQPGVSQEDGDLVALHD